ncbi:MAG: ABC transporter substrate-binding protein [Reyranella sp.]|uniref:ABC transporter substrate-binding protein n=1 Tax=Reyranella sp. TaxID=1929291 RepID=UPI001ACF1EDC|nr:ABC transporter substrate-binding protein [Reyranella sp.]MBN9088047.1 ABC transporter substrate-binding protein [Reyranella sp.]
MRRLLLSMVLWAIALPASAQGTLRMVSHADLKILDPIWTTANITRNHGYLIYDTLLATDADFKVQPQMAEKVEISADKLTYTITLRDGLEWHDGTPVTPEDCIASIRRWGARDGFGQLLLRSTAELKPIDGKTFALVLKEPFGLVLEALGKVGSSVPFMMPRRVAETDPNKQIDDYTGSGPFIFKKDEWKAGEKVVYVRNPKYKPRPEPPSMLAGGKQAKVDRVEWLAMPDPNTAANALIAGEIDLIESPPTDLLPLLKGSKGVALYGWNVQGGQALMRFNHLQPPFDNPKVRQAAMLAIAQEDFLRAQYGDPALYRTCNAPFICGSTYGKEYGDFLIKPDIEKAKALLKEAGYDGKPVVMLHQTDLQSSNQFQPVAKQQLERAGFKVELLPMDWNTVVARRSRKEAPAQGGWNIFFTTNITIDVDNPGTSNFAAASCEKAWFGWPCDPEIEKLRAAFIAETDTAKRKALGDAISDKVMAQGVYVPIGQYRGFGAYRSDRLDGWLPGPVAMVWNIRKR